MWPLCNQIQSIAWNWAARMAGPVSQIRHFGGTKFSHDIAGEPLQFIQVQNGQQAKSILIPLIKISFFFFKREKLLFGQEIHRSTVDKPPRADSKPTKRPRGYSLSSVISSPIFLFKTLAVSKLSFLGFLLPISIRWIFSRALIQYMITLVWFIWSL